MGLKLVSRAKGIEIIVVGEQPDYVRKVLDKSYMKEFNEKRRGSRY